MKIYEIIDEKNRLVRWYATMEESGQVKSHGYSYLYAREIQQECGDVMGLDKLLVSDVTRNGGGE